MVEQSRRPEQAVRQHVMAAQVLVRQLHMAAQLPRNFIVDQTKWGSLVSPSSPPSTQLWRLLTGMRAPFEPDSRLRRIV